MSQPIPSAALGWALRRRELVGLRLPPNAVKIIAGCQTSGRFPAPFNRPPANTQPSSSQPAKSLATARRPTPRSHSQPNMLRSGGASTYARAGGVPVAKPVPQPHDGAYYQPPPIKARARRVALAARSRARASTMPMVIDAPTNPFTPTSSSTDPTQSAWSPALQAGPSSELARRAQEISQLPGLGGIPIGLIQQVLPRLEEGSNFWVAGDAGTSWTGDSCSSQSTVYENPLPPVMEEASTTEAPEVPHPTSITESLPLEQPEPFTSAGELELEPTMGWDWLDTLVFPQPMEPLTVEPPPTAEPEQPTWPTTDESEEPTQTERPRRTVSGLEYLLDLEHSSAVEAAQSVTRIAPPTREEIERSLGPLPKDMCYSTGFGHCVDMGEAGMGILGPFAVDFQDGGWRGFLDFGCLDDM
ncbi:hypothetical protein BJV74DRAFT_886724 [Russula compacta]|nr:hypothetical protein BJV74DRAFT_886724 [Russula compacta]